MILPALLVTAFFASAQTTAPEKLPPGAVARVGSSAFRDSASLRFLGTSPDVKRVYTLGDSLRPQPAALLEGQWQPVRWQHDGLLVWDAGTGRLLSRRPLVSDGEEVDHVGFGADGVRVVVILYLPEKSVEFRLL